MHQNAIIAISATLGIAVGAGGTYIATSEPKVEAQAISKAELVAAISADPSLCPIPTVEAPTEAEALAAYRKAHAASPLVWDRKNLPEISLALGQCDKADAGPGVACMTSVKMSPDAQPVDRIVGIRRIGIRRVDRNDQLAEEPPSRRLLFRSTYAIESAERMTASIFSVLSERLVANSKISELQP